MSTNPTTCSKCHQTFSNKYTLATHQKNVNCVKESVNKIFMCKDCNSEFSSKQWLTNHLDICVEKRVNDEKRKFEELLLLSQQREKEYEEKIREKEKEMKESEEKFKESLVLSEIKLESAVEKYNIKMDEMKRQSISDKVYIAKLKAEADTKDQMYKLLLERYEKIIKETNHITNNNNTINITMEMVYPKEYIEKIIKEHLTSFHLAKGVGGVVEFIRDYIAKKNQKIVYKCTDVSRQIFKYEDIEGNVIKDVKASKLLGVLNDILWIEYNKHRKYLKDQLEIYENMLYPVTTNVYDAYKKCGSSLEHQKEMEEKIELTKQLIESLEEKTFTFNNIRSNSDFPKKMTKLLC